MTDLADVEFSTYNGTIHPVTRYEIDPDLMDVMEKHIRKRHLMQQRTAEKCNFGRTEQNWTGNSTKPGVTNAIQHRIYTDRYIRHQVN